MFSSDVASGSISTWWGLDFYDEVWKGKNEQCEHVLFGEMLLVLDKGHVDDFAVRNTPVFLPVDHQLEVLVDRGIEHFRFWSWRMKRRRLRPLSIVELPSNMASASSKAAKSWLS